MLTADEIARLEAGLPRLSAWGANLLVPFQARKLCRASVAWMNERWFLERGVDVTEPGTRQRTTTWLLDEFGYHVPRPEDPAEAYADQEQTFHADRYGGSGHVTHGGSGRAGLRGCFQAKGIGVTPLVGDVRSWTYSHGCAWLEEALREAIYAEIAAVEFPHGAVPVIAVLDTGLRYQFPSGELGERRAILVRPASLRLAHFERAPIFRAAALDRAERPEREVNETSDVDRVRDAVHAFHAYRVGEAPGIDVGGLADAFARVAEQAAFGQVHRLCHGGYLTSNVTLNGELLDFGSFRAVADWSKVFPLDNIPGFGDELSLLVPAIKSLSFFFRKYGPSGSAPQERALLAEAQRALEARFDRECLRLWNLDETRDQAVASVVVGAMREYFAAQQKQVGSYQLGYVPLQTWIGDALEAGTAAPESDPSVERRLLDRIGDALTAHFGSSAHPRRRLSWLTAQRLLRARPSLYRERLQGWLWDRLGGQSSPEPPDPAAVSEAIDSCLSRGRRHWPLLAGGLAVEAQVSTGASSALLCRDVADESLSLWIEGVRSGDRVRLFDRWVELDALRGFQVASEPRRWAGRFPAGEDGGVDGAPFAVPPLERWYSFVGDCER
jgi:hypothetical protein